MTPDHILITARRDGAAYRVSVSASSDRVVIAEFTASAEDLPALVDAHLVGLLGMNEAAA